MLLDNRATHLRRDTIKAYPFALSLSKGERKNPTTWKLSPSWFDKLTTNGCVNNIGDRGSPSTKRRHRHSRLAGAG